MGGGKAIRGIDRHEKELSSERYDKVLHDMDEARSNLQVLVLQYKKTCVHEHWFQGNRRKKSE